MKKTKNNIVKKNEYFAIFAELKLSKVFFSFLVVLRNDKLVKF